MSSNKPTCPELPVVIIDDELHALQSYEMALRSSGINNIMCCQDSREVMTVLSQTQVSALLLDLWMPNFSGEDLLESIKQEHPEIPIIIITGVNEVATAVRCMKKGAIDYLVKPIEKNQIISAVKRAIELCELRVENFLLKKQILEKEETRHKAFSHIITNNEQMMAIFGYIEATARTPHAFLITGETGVGKELIARAIHTVSGRLGKFVAVNIAGLDDNTIADTLFGHKKGAFTGADSTRRGLIESANSGTLFLDEVGDLSQPSQVKILRFLEGQEYLPLGADIYKRSDARIIFATNIDIEEAQKSGRFRKDLYYRLRTHHVHVPPLRERKDDIPLLSESFLKNACRDLCKNPPEIPQMLYPLLSSYSFPGNVRELKSMILDAISSHQKGPLSLEIFQERIGIQDIPATQYDDKGFLERSISSSDRSGSLPTLKEITHQLISEAMRRAKGNQGVAASMLGISRQALNRRLNQNPSPSNSKDLEG